MKKATEFNRNSKIKRNKNAFKKKWDFLKSKYRNQKEAFGRTGSGGGAPDKMFEKVDSLLKDDPTITPPCTYSSLARKLTVNTPNRESREEGEGSPSLSSGDTQGESSAQEPAKKKRMTNAEKKRVLLLNQREEFLDNFKKISNSIQNFAPLRLSEEKKKNLELERQAIEQKKECYSSLNALIKKISDDYDKNKH